MLRRIFKFQEIGWSEINEEFTRYTIFTCRFFTIYLHELSAPTWHPECHDHPWTFIAILLKNGYDEMVDEVIYRRRPGSILYRPAEFIHNVITPYGKSWSLILTGPHRRQWGFKTCK